MDIFHNSPQCPHCADLWKQADCTLNGSVNDTLKDVGAGATFDTLKGAAEAHSMGTSVVKGVGESLAEGTATSFFAIYTYAKTMITAGWRMVAGCQ